jgi:glyoxylase-like metal-dependent hydrolase (beta-lactamase superfamily II)
MIFGDNGGRFPHCHTFLLIEGEEITLFDPQCGRDLLERELNKMSKSWKSIKNIVNTHFHVDHTSSNAFIKSKNNNVQILIHRNDAKAMANMEDYLRQYGLTGDAKTHYKSIFENLGYRQTTPDRIFKEGDLIPGGFKVIHTPGHTPGHCCFYKSDILIAGDVDLVGRPWVSNATSNVNDFYNSINKLLKLDVSTFLPGHGRPILDKNEILSELIKYQKKLINTGKKVLDLIDKQLTIEEILNKRYGDKDITIWDQNPLMKIFRRYDTINYLYYLEQMGKIRKIESNRLNLWEKK